MVSYNLGMDGMRVQGVSTIWNLEKIILESTRAFEIMDSVSRDGAIFQVGQMWEKGSMIWWLVWFCYALYVCVLGEREVMSRWWGVRGVRCILSSINSHFISFTCFFFMCSAFLYINVFSPLITLADNWLNTVPPQRTRGETKWTLEVFLRPTLIFVQMD